MKSVPIPSTALAQTLLPRVDAVVHDMSIVSGKLQNDIATVEFLLQLAPVALEGAADSLAIPDTPIVLPLGQRPPVALYQRLRWRVHLQRFGCMRTMPNHEEMVHH